MKWFKHHANTHDTPAMATLLEEYGVEGFGRLMLILEHVCQRSDYPRFELSLSVLQWATILKAKPKKLLPFVDRLAELQQISVECSGNVLTIGAPNLAKWRDEYSEKSRYAPERLGTVEPEPDSDTDSRGQREIESRAARARAPRLPSETSVLAEALAPIFSREAGQSKHASKHETPKSQNEGEKALRWVRDNLNSSPEKVADMLGSDPALAQAVTRSGGWATLCELLASGGGKADRTFLMHFGRSCATLRGPRRAAHSNGSL